MLNRDRVRSPLSPTPAVGLSLGAVILVCAACGGRAAARPISAPEPEIAPSSRDDIARPAVRLDSDTRETHSGATAVGTPPATSAPARGVYHVFQPGQTLYSIARSYQVPLATLMRANGITNPRTVRDGTTLFIPEAGRTHDVPPTFVPAREVTPRQSSDRDASSRDPQEIDASVLGAPGGLLPQMPPSLSGAPSPSAPPRALPPVPVPPGLAPPAPLLAWPLRGTITSGFGRRGRHHHHEGVDIDGVLGEEILAAATGTVVRAGREGRYGRVVVIDHGGGLITLYAHASRLLVREGDEVRRGEPIAEVGHSGNARGSHLHFEVHRDGRPIDPLPILRGGATAARDSD